MAIIKRGAFAGAVVGDQLVVAGGREKYDGNTVDSAECLDPQTNMLDRWL